MLRKTSSPTMPDGFTLLEMLVVLILTGMITGILIQGLHQVFRLQTHFGTELFNTQQGEMYTEWFRHSVNGMIPDYDDGKHKFHGSLKEFGGMTLSPLNTATESLQPFSWQLRFDSQTGRTQLQYGLADNAPVILSWAGNSGKFVYFDNQNKEHDTWPPFLGIWPQLPKAIYLDNQNSDEPRIIVASPKGPENPLPRDLFLQD